MDSRADALAVAAQALAANAIRGLWWSEREDNPEVASVAVEVGEGGAIDVTLLDVTGHHIGGYSL